MLENKQKILELKCLKPAQGGSLFLNKFKMAYTQNLDD